MATLPVMPESLAARGSRRGRRALVALGEELRGARLAAGLSLREVGAAAEISPTEVSRIERGVAPWVDVLAASRLCAIVGLDLAIRAYPGGDPLRDAGHLKLLASFRSRLGSGLELRTEVPIGDERDRRAWDATIYDGERVAAVELESRLVDAQALVRRIHLKARDSGIDRVMIVLSDTNGNRRGLAAAEPLPRAGFPLPPPRVLTALAGGRVPEASGIVLLRLGRSVRRSAVGRKQ